MSRRMISVQANYGQNSGASALFPTPIFPVGFFYHLPLDELIGVPLILQNGHSASVVGTANLRRNLYLSGGWGRSLAVYSITQQQSFDHVNVDARYQFGKFSLQAGFYWATNGVEAATSGLMPLSNHVASRRIYFRFTRNFAIF